MRTFLYCALWRRFGAKITHLKSNVHSIHILYQISTHVPREFVNRLLPVEQPKSRFRWGHTLSWGQALQVAPASRVWGEGVSLWKVIIANLMWKWNCSYGNRAKREIPGSKKFVPGYVLEPTGEYRHIAGILGEISQYAQFAAAFGRIVSGKSAATGRRIDSGAAIRKFSCRG